MKIVEEIDVAVESPGNKEHYKCSNDCFYINFNLLEFREPFAANY